MQTPILRCTLLSAAISGLLAAPVQASEWNGSYLANGQCFCAGELSSSVRDKLVPTPIGGQTVGQICDRIGDGPKLTRTDGTFNFPVYDDPQCGHGPFAAGATVDESCSGAYEPGVDCQGAGSKWNVSALYQEQTAKTTVAQSTSTAVTGGSRYIDPAAFRASDDTVAKDTTVKTDKVVKQVSDAAVVSTTPTYVDPQTQTAKAPAQPVSKQPVVKPIAQPSVAATAPAESEAALLARQQQRLEAERKKQWDQATANATDSAKAQQEQAAAELAALQAAKDAEQAKQARIDKAANDVKLAEQAKLDEAKLAEQARIDEEAKIAEQARIAKEAKVAEQARIDAEAKVAEQARIDAEAKAAARQASAEAVAKSNDKAAPVAPMAALQLPKGVETNYNDFQYVQALPMGYDYGGAGVAVSGSYSSLGKWHYVGRAAVADSYNELFVGAGYHITPPSATRMTVVATAGLEYGRFQLSSGSITTDDSDSGLALRLGSRFVLNQKIELQGTLGYSSFFDGDIHFMGGGFYHINKQLDLTSQFEIGDNDSFGLGIRYYY